MTNHAFYTMCIFGICDHVLVTPAYVMQGLHSNACLKILLSQSHSDIELHALCL